MCKCSICGETLTAPVIIDNQIFGWSCAKKIYPNISKPKNKWIKADTYTQEFFDNGNVGTTAVVAGKKYYGVCIVEKGRDSNIGVQVIEGIAYVDLNLYKKRK